MRDEKGKDKKIASSAKELAYSAVFVALLIGGQLALSVLPGVEIVTVLYVAYAYVFGIRRGMVAATAFSLLRQLVFGFYPTVLILYLIYFNALAVLFGWLGGRKKERLPALTLIACLSTASFTMIDNILTSLWYGYTWKMAKTYFLASLPVMLPQIVCTAVTVSLLFLPVRKIFTAARSHLKD